METRTKVLVMIEDRDFRSQFAEELANLNMQVVYSEENHIQRVFDEVPHILVIDEDFESGDGKNIAQQIKADLILKHIPVFLLSRRPPPFQPNFRDPIDQYCLKDRSFQEILASLQEVLSRNYNELDVNPFTHLPGTRSSILRIERAVSSNKLLAFCCFHMADLEAYVSVYGDARGDEIIIQLSKIIKEVLKKHDFNEDFVGHLGQDNFIVVTHSEFAVRVCEAIIQKFDLIAPNFYDTDDRRLGYILQRDLEGVLVRHPIVSLSSVVIHNDNLALMEVSEYGRITTELNKYMQTLPGSCYIEYNPKSFNHQDRNANVLDVHFPSKMKHLTVTNPLRDADKHKVFFDKLFADQKIEVRYQPILDLKTKQIVGYEALAHSMVKSLENEASLLFSMARESGKIKELDKLCFEMALENAQNLGPDQKLFLNLNHETLIDPVLMKELFYKKGRIGFKNIVLEVTEQSILRSFQKIQEALKELREQGVAVAIDDVGGGAVSLRDVALLKPNYFKFDRSLIRRIDSSQTKQQIVLSMILFANGIHAVTEAEGIETKEEYEAVQKCGVTLGQGFYFAKASKTLIKSL